MWYIKSIVLCQWGQPNCNNLNVGQKLFVLEMLLIAWGIWHVDPLFSTTSLNKYREHKSSFFPCRDSLLSCILFFYPNNFFKFCYFNYLIPIFCLAFVFQCEACIILLQVCEAHTVVVITIHKNPICDFVVTHNVPPWAYRQKNTVIC